MRLLFCLSALLLGAGASGVAAQTDPRLTAAVRAAQEGQGDPDATDPAPGDIDRTA